MSTETATRRGPGLPVFALSAAASSWLALPDVGFRDAGELGTAAHGLGVAHPTGFAVDMLLLRAASLLPFGPVAFRQNLCVALTAAAALGLVAQLSDALSRALGIEQVSARWAGAALAAAGLFGWLTFAGTAFSTEVYSLALACGLLAALGAVQGGRAAGMALLVAGFAVGLHVTAGLYALLAMALRSQDARGAVRHVAARLPVVSAGAAIVAYLPLASLRDPALDWGDPETPARIFAHLSAARIRGAYSDEMLSAAAKGSTEAIAQWLELWPLAPFALLAIGYALHARKLAVLLLPCALCAADLAYSVFINPMGAVDRQVGHMAGASVSVLAGVGAAAACGALVQRRPAARWLGAGCVVALAAVMALRLPRSALADGYAAAELHGSGGPLASVPPRAIVLCSTDDACAGGLFALHVERVRPDVEVLPAQHLWDRTVLRRLGTTPDPQALLPVEPAPAARGAAAREVAAALLGGAGGRPLLLETRQTVRGVPGLTLDLAEVVPYLRAVDGPRGPIDAASLERLDRMRAVRFADGLPREPRAQYAWSRAYGAVGEQALGRQPELTLRALRIAAKLAPRRAAAWVNLGTALAAAGDLDAAIDVTHRGLRLAPERATAWVNLARFTLRRNGPRAAREVLRSAAHAGIRDPRLDQLQFHVVERRPHADE